MKNPFHDCRVKADGVADFLDRYYRQERYTGRGNDYAASLLACYKEEYRRNGYIFISRHDSVTGRVVSWDGERP
jgi:hypothetical protein